MQKLKITYLITILLLISLSLYLDHHKLTTGVNFHQLSKLERNTIRFVNLSTIIATPAAIVGIIFLPKKPVGYKTSTLALIYLLSIYPSYRIHRHYYKDIFTKT